MELSRHVGCLEGRIGSRSGVSSVAGQWSELWLSCNEAWRVVSDGKTEI